MSQCSNTDVEHQMALHQGGIEQIFLDSMASNGVEVERPMIPTSIELSEDQSTLNDPKSHPVKVGYHRPCDCSLQ